MSKSRLLIQFRTFRVQTLYFYEISRCFCMVFAGEAQKSHYFDQKPWYLKYFLDFLSNIKVFNQNNVIFELLRQNDAESSRNFIKNSVLDPKRAKFNQKSLFGHVQPCQDQSRRTSPCWRGRCFVSRNYTFRFYTRIYYSKNTISLNELSIQ